MQKYFMAEGGLQKGPFTLEELVAHKITASTPAWFYPMPEWKPAGQIDELKALFNSSPVAASPLITKDIDWAKASIYYTDNSGQHGPVKADQLVSAGIKTETPVWYDPLPEWTTAGKAPGLLAFLNQLAASSAAAPAVQAAPKPVDIGSRQYFFVDGAGRQGPFSLAELGNKNILSSTMVWYESLPYWVTANNIPELNGILNKTSVPPPHDAIATTPKETDWTAVDFYYADQSGQKGPFKLSQLTGKNIDATTPVWYAPLPEWTTAGNVAVLKPVIDSKPVPPLVTISLSVPESSVLLLLLFANADPSKVSYIQKCIAKWWFYQDFRSQDQFNALAQKFQELKTANPNNDDFIQRCNDSLKKEIPHRDITFYLCAELICLNQDTETVSKNSSSITDLADQMGIDLAIGKFVVELEQFRTSLNGDRN